MIVSLPLILMTLGIFFWSVVVAASDGQGALVFLLTIPVMLVILWGSMQWSKKKESRIGHKASLATAVFIICFVVFAFIPGMNIFSLTIMDVTTKAFEKVTGKTPYKYFREKNDIFSLVYEDAKTPEEIDMTSYQTARDWDRVCFLGPETTDDDVKKIIGSDYKVSSFEGLKSNLVTAVMYVNKDELSYPIVVPRKVADFSRLAGQCIPKEKARFRETPPGSKIYL